MNDEPSQLKEWIRPFYLKWLYFPLRPQARPEQWRQCWEYPRSDEIPPGVKGKSDVIVLPMTDWHARRQRAQHLSMELAALGHRVFYLNPNLGREFPHPVLTGSRKAVCRLAERVYELHIGLPREPVFHHRMLHADESAAVADFLGLFCNGAPILLSQFPLWNSAAAVVRERSGGSLIYDCHDLLSGFSRISPEIIAAENGLFERADIVVFSAKSLLEKKTGEMPWLLEKSHIIRNAVDAGHFQAAEGSRRKVIGYAGSLDEWFDVDAVEVAASRYQQCDFVLLGRIEDAKVRRLERLPNVRFFGEIPYDRLPVYLKDFDVALIPFLVTPLTLATNPIKLYEYFACGLPVVSSPLPEVAGFEPLTYIAGTPEMFADQIGRALAENDPQKRNERRRIAERESWNERAEALVRLTEGSPPHKTK